MKTVIYQGTANFQEFGKADFAKAGVEQGKLVFERDVPKEVSDEVYDALLSTDADESIFHDFSFAPGPEDEEDMGEEDDAEVATKKAAKKSAKSAKAAQTDSGSDQQNLDADAGTTSSTAPVGNGSSTTGSTP